MSWGCFHCFLQIHIFEFLAESNFSLFSSYISVSFNNRGYLTSLSTSTWIDVWSHMQYNAASASHSTGRAKAPSFVSAVVPTYAGNTQLRHWDESSGASEQVMTTGSFHQSCSAHEQLAVNGGPRQDPSVDGAGSSTTIGSLSTFGPQRPEIRHECEDLWREKTDRTSGE